MFQWRRVQNCETGFLDVRCISFHDAAVSRSALNNRLVDFSLSKFTGDIEIRVGLCNSVNRSTWSSCSLLLVAWGLEQWLFSKIFISGELLGLHDGCID